MFPICFSYVFLIYYNKNDRYLSVYESAILNDIKVIMFSVIYCRSDIIDFLV